MTGQAYWLTPALILLGGAAVVLFIRWSSRSTSYFLRQRDRIVCPISQELATCTFVEDVRTGQLAGLVRCSLHAGKHCAQDCVERINQGQSLSRPRR